MMRGKRSNILFYILIISCIKGISSRFLKTADQDDYTDTDDYNNNTVPASPTYEGFEGCRQYTISTTSDEKPPEIPYKKINLTASYSETNKYQLTNGSMLAIYPMSDDGNLVQLVIELPTTIFKTSIEGTLVRLVKCNTDGDNCTLEEQKSTKSPDIIDANHWNYVYVTTGDSQITISVGPTIKVMTMSQIDPSELKQAWWYVTAKDTKDYSKDHSQHQPSRTYLVKFKCNEVTTEPQHTTVITKAVTEYPYKTSSYTTGDSSLITTRKVQTTHSPIKTTYYITHDFQKVTTATPGTDPAGNTALIAGILVGVILLLVLVIIGITAYRRHKSLAINEGTPLQQQEK